MKRSRFNEAQIINILKQQESGMTIVQICREQGISEGTFYRWKSKYGGMEVHEGTRLRELEQENARLKKLLAESMLDNAALKDVLSKKWYSLRLSDRSQAISKNTINFLTDAPVRWPEFPLARLAIGADAKTRHLFALVSKNWPKSDHVLVIDAWACCYAAKGTRSTRSECCACTEKRTSSCAPARGSM